MPRAKNVCGYCGRYSGTNAPFPKKEVTGNWLAVICPKCYSLESIHLIEHKAENPDEMNEIMIRQEKNLKKRKMVGNDKMNLIFWFDDDDSIYGFQLCRSGEVDYDAFTWSVDRESKYQAVENQRRRLDTNTLKDTEHFPGSLILEMFQKYSGNIKNEYRDLVIEKLKQYSH